MSVQMPPERGPYELPEVLREEIFLQVVVPDILLASGPEPQERPEVILLGGQPGAGKSTAAHGFEREFAQRGGLIVVDGDDLRPLHPAYEQLIAERPGDMPEVIQETVRWWLDRATAYLWARRYNVLLQGRFAGPGEVMQTAERFAAAGYEVRVAAMAVPAALSRLGIIERYATQVDQVGTGRWVPNWAHDGNYDGTREVLRLATANPAVHRITVLTRDGTVYDRPTNRAPTVASPVDVLEEARAEPFSRLKRTALANRLADTLDRLRATGAGHDDLYDMAAAVHDDLMANAVLAGQAPGHHGQSVGDQLDAALADLDAAGGALDASAALPEPGQEPPAPPGPDVDPGLA